MTAPFTPAQIRDALTRKCQLCKAPEGQDCVTLTDLTPIPRRVHYYRLEDVK